MCIMSEPREEASFRDEAHSLYSFDVVTTKSGFWRPASAGRFFCCYKRRAATWQKRRRRRPSSR
uniref:Uncharacterized protein n=1 Tax=Ackermannviridae sp. TaxID=2831612 RepID=A0A8S5VVP1_9CAUD|nr:MAG TPA: hypothetical protein [Ackermannviridae sp.]